MCAVSSARQRDVPGARRPPRGRSAPPSIALQGGNAQTRVPQAATEALFAAARVDVCVRDVSARAKADERMGGEYFSTRVLGRRAVPFAPFRIPHRASFYPKILVLKC